MKRRDEAKPHKVSKTVFLHLEFGVAMATRVDDRSAIEFGSVICIRGR